MDIFIIVVSIVLGLLIGSFLNVVALRFNTGKSLGGRSGCFSCGNQLSWYELVPVFSWIFQKGRCRKCSSKVSSFYFFGEITTATFFGLIAARGLGSSVDFLSLEYLLATIFLFVTFSILIIILLYDMRHKIIPDSLSFTFGLLGFISVFFFTFESGLFLYSGIENISWHQLLGGIVVPLPFIILWLVSKGKWIGLGDPKLMVGIGFFFGIAQGISTVFVAFWLGALFAIALVVTNVVLKKRLLRSGKKSIMKEEIPFAPFLIVATLITLVWDITLF